MKAIKKVLSRIGEAPSLFLLGWLSGVIGSILGFSIAHIISSAWR